MWKAQLICDVCHQVYVEVSYKGANDVVRCAKGEARDAGWVYTHGIGWECVHCIAAPRKELGERALYLGSIVTPMGVPLKGMYARILLHKRDTRTVHALFEDPNADNYHHRAHWFFEVEFSPLDTPDAKDATDASGSGLGQA